MFREEKEATGKSLPEDGPAQALQGGREGKGRQTEGQGTSTRVTMTWDTWNLLVTGRNEDARHETVTWNC